MVNADFFGGLIAKLAIFLVRIVPTESWYFFSYILTLSTRCVNVKVINTSHISFAPQSVALHANTPGLEDGSQTHRTEAKQSTGQGQKETIVKCVVPSHFILGLY